jgi:RNA polymerase sigma-70 factor (ECF subfamily)
MMATSQEQTFRRWLTEHLGLMWKVVRGSSAAPQDQEDLFQEVLLQLWSSIPAFRGTAKETTWIYRVAFNTVLAWGRGEKRRRRTMEALHRAAPELEAQAREVVAAPEPEILERLYAAIRALPKMDASLALMHLEGLSYREITEVLGISENHVGVKLTRIRQQLAQQLEDIYHEL